MKLPRHGVKVFLWGTALIVIAATASYCGLNHRWLRWVDSLEWIGSNFCAVLLTYLSYREASPPVKNAHRLLIFSMLSVLVGQIIRQTCLYLGIPPFPSPAQAFSLSSGLFMISAFLACLPDGLSEAERRATKLDLLCITVGIFTIILCLEIPQFPDIPPVATFCLIAFPLVFLTAATIGLVVLLLGKFRVGWNHLLLILLLAWIGSGYLTRQQMFNLRHPETTGRFENYLIAFVTLLIALSMSAWEIKEGRSLLLQKICATILRLLPLGMIITALTAIALNTQLSPMLRVGVDFGAIMTIALSFVRQSLLILEQEEFLKGELQLEMHENHLKIVAEHTSDIIFEIAVERDGSFRYLSNNRAGKENAIFGGDFAGQSPHEFFPKHWADRFVANYSRCVLKSAPITYDQQIPHVDGPIWVETTLVPIHNPKGEVIQIMGISRNISTYRTELEASHNLQIELEKGIRKRTRELEEAYRDLEGFSYSVSHDLRAPLRGIIGFCKILMEDYSPRLDAQGKGYLDRIAKAGQRMGEIIDDLLRFSRISRSQLLVTEVNLSLLAEKITSDLQAAAPDRKVSFLITPDLKTRGDVRLLLNVLENLLGNAWKYSNRCALSTIEFGQQVGERETIFFVRDNGAGFDMAYAGKLFQLFQRLHDATEFEGTGIGLAMTARIIERHQGRIWAESAPEKGSTFYFTLPANIGMVWQSS